MHWDTRSRVAIKFLCDIEFYYLVHGHGRALVSLKRREMRTIRTSSIIIDVIQ